MLTHKIFQPHYSGDFAPMQEQSDFLNVFLFFEAFVDLFTFILEETNFSLEDMFSS